MKERAVQFDFENSRLILGQRRGMGAVCVGGGIKIYDEKEYVCQKTSFGLLQPHGEPAISHHTTSLGEWGEMAEFPAERYCAF